jgi:hypothetical protein
MYVYIFSSILIHKLGEFSEENNVIDMAAFQAISNEINIKWLHLLTSGGVRLHIWILNINISDAIDKVINDLSFDS